MGIRNIDRIRAMSVEELASLLTNYNFTFNECCKWLDTEYNSKDENTENKNSKSDLEQWEDWLKRWNIKYEKDEEDDKYVYLNTVNDYGIYTYYTFICFEKKTGKFYSMGAGE